MNELNFYKDLLLKHYDEITTDIILDGIKTNKKVTLRVNTLKASVEEIISEFNNLNIEFKQVDWYKDAFIIENMQERDLQDLEIYKQGKIYLQNLSSMLPAIILNPNANDNILDMCAAPGGKTTQMACLSGNKAFITAIERNKIRGEKLKYNLQKQGAGTVNVMFEDARNLSDYFKFDKILLDAPCSGSGTENVFKSNFTKELIEKSAKTQEALLRKALKLLKQGGELIYSTCSILKDENENILEKCIKNSDCRLKSFELSNEIKCLPSKFDEVKTIAPNEYFEGFFVAKIIKEVGSEM